MGIDWRLIARTTRCLFVPLLALISILGDGAHRMIFAASIKPDPVVQARLREIGTAVDDTGTKRGQDSLFRAVQTLQPYAKDQPELVRQLIWHHANATDQAQAMTLFFVVDLLDVPKNAMVQAIAPILGESGDKGVNQACVEVANIIEDGDVERGFDFSHYRSHIEGRLRRMQDVEPGLVQHIFRRSAGQALQSFTMASYREPEARKALLWARHAVDDALWRRQYGFAPSKEPEAAVTEELEKMAGRDEYWARLYAAEVVRQHPEFGTEELVTRLRKDSHPLVQKTANAIRPVIRQ